MNVRGNARMIMWLVAAFAVIVVVPLWVAAAQREREAAVVERARAEQARERAEARRREVDRERSAREGRERGEREGRERGEAERERERERPREGERDRPREVDRPRAQRDPVRLGPGDLRRVLDGLEHGIGALRAIRQFEEAEHLQRIAQRVRRELQDEPAESREAERHRGQDRERAMALKQLEIMKMALPALREGEKADAADLLQRAIRAREVTLEGRRDAEAQEIRNRAPKLGGQAEILGLASRLWREFGDERKSRAVGELARWMTQMQRRQTDRPVQRDREVERQRGERERGERDREVERERDEREHRDREHAERERDRDDRDRGQREHGERDRPPVERDRP